MKKLNTIFKIALLFIAIHFYQSANAQSPEAIKLFEEGRTFYGKSDYDQAINSFTEAIKLHASYSDAYNWRGYVYHAKKEYDIAISDYKEASRLNPTFANPHFNLGMSYYKKQNYDEAINEFDEAIKLDPKEKFSYQWKGDALQQKKQYDAAITCYNEIIRLTPKDLSGYRLRATAYNAKKEYDRAINEYNQMLRIDSLSHATFNNRAIAYRNQKLYDLALADHNQAITLGPKETSYYYARAATYKEKGDIASAIKDYDETISLIGKSSAYLSRAYFFNRIGKTDEALKDFNEAIRLDPKYIYAYTGRGNFYRKLGKYEISEADYAKAIELDPKNTAGYYGRAVVSKDKGNYLLAIKDYETCFILNPKITTTNVAILSPLLRTNQTEKAKEYADKFLEKKQNTYLDTDKWRFYSYYVTVVAKNLPDEKYDEALTNLERALKDYSKYITEEDDSKSEYTDILALKGFVLDRLGRYAVAKEVYEQALLISPSQPDVRDAIIAINAKLTVQSGSDKLPPAIQLISPETGRGLHVTASGSNNIEIIGRAKDPSGIASVTVNGIMVSKVEDDGLFLSKVSLKPGANNLIIAATDKKGNKTAKTFILNGQTVPVQKSETEIVMPVAGAENAPQYHAILIAVNDYADPAIPDLENPVKDASN
ncbi:MAG: hypothetical protein JWQ25_627 [Daejeonella sp.]|nr:hypothetical protein [Daejeonella sp.]